MGGGKVPFPTPPFRLMANIWIVEKLMKFHFYLSDPVLRARLFKIYVFLLKILWFANLIPGGLKINR